MSTTIIQPVGLGELVADQLRAHLPDPGHILTPEQRLGSPGNAASHALHVEPGDIHCVHNTSDEVAITLHIHGTDVTRVGSSARRYYDR